MFNIQNAINYGNRNCKPGSTGLCAKHVRLMLEAGGLNTTGHPAYAYQYANFLPRLGFKLIATLTNKNNQSIFTQTQARLGDIAVMKHGKYGHICMFNGTNWISDFKQINMCPYTVNEICKIYRFQ